jgi:hypothetical protein
MGFIKTNKKRNKDSIKEHMVSMDMKEWSHV